jgi:uncharacterized protein (DUF1778 family)
MKRTPTNGGEKRDAVFRFRVTAAEKEIIKQNAARTGMSVSDYIRKRADEAIANNNRETLIRLLAETGKQGSNLNQMARAFNIWVKRGDDPEIEPGMLRHCIDEITRLSRELMEIIKHGYRRKNQG